MPSKQKSLCTEPGCTAFAEIGNKCKDHYKRIKKDSRKEYKGWYSNKPWRILRQKWLFSNPLCVECKKQGTLTPADTVDHIIPHRGDWHMFMDPENLQSLCKECHDRKTAKSDGGFGNKKINDTSGQ